MIAPDEDWRGFLQLALVKDYQIGLLAPDDDVGINGLISQTDIPDLILMDADAQDICTMQLLEAIKTREQFSCVNLVLISAIPANRQEICARNAGAAFLPKPFTYQELKSVLAQF